jgi:hypothetical protein
MFGPRQFIGKEADPVDEAGHRAFSRLTKAVTLLLKVERNDVAIAVLWSTVHGLAHLALDQQLGKMMGKGTIDRC